MSKRSQHLAVRALPGLGAELRAYKRRAVRDARRRASEATQGSAMRRALWARLERLRTMTPAEMRGWYQSEAIQRITRTPRDVLIVTLASSRRNDVRMVCA